MRSDKDGNIWVYINWPFLLFVVMAFLMVALAADYGGLWVIYYGVLALLNGHSAYLQWRLM